MTGLRAAEIMVDELSPEAMLALERVLVLTLQPGTPRAVERQGELGFLADLISEAEAAFRAGETSGEFLPRVPSISMTPAPVRRHQRHYPLAQARRLVPSLPGRLVRRWPPRRRRRRS